MLFNTVSFLLLLAFKNNLYIIVDPYPVTVYADFGKRREDVLDLIVPGARYFFRRYIPGLHCSLSMRSYRNLAVQVVIEV